MANVDPMVPAKISFEGDAPEALSAFPLDVKKSFGFSLRRLQLGKEAACSTRSMNSIGAGVYELKEADERAWYRVIYLSKVNDVIYVLHCFEKSNRKTDRRDIALSAQRLKMVRQRIEEQKADDKLGG